MPVSVSGYRPIRCGARNCLCDCLASSGVEGRRVKECGNGGGGGRKEGESIGRGGLVGV